MEFYLYRIFIDRTMGGLSLPARPHGCAAGGSFVKSRLIIQNNINCSKSTDIREHCITRKRSSGTQARFCSARKFEPKVKFFLLEKCLGCPIFKKIGATRKASQTRVRSRNSSSQRLCFFVKIQFYRHLDHISHVFTAIQKNNFQKF